MCTVSMIGDEWARRRQPDLTPYIVGPPYVPTVAPVTRAEFEALRKEMTELRELLLAAKKYDEATGQPDCEMEDKVALIKRIAEMVGVDMKDVFGA